MAGVVGLGTQEPVLVIASEADDLGRAFTAKRENRIHAASGVWTSVDVIAE